MSSSSKKRKTSEFENETVIEPNHEGTATLPVTTNSTTTTTVAAPLTLQPQNNENDRDDDNDEDDASSSSDDDLILEGVMVRNHDVSDEDDYEDDDDDDDEEEEPKEKRDNEEEEEDQKIDSATSQSKTVNATASKGPVVEKQTSAQRQVNKTNKKKKKKRKKKRSSNDSDDDDDILNVDFTFCDMDEKYFHGIKSLLQNGSSSTFYHTHSSALTDLMIDNVAIGTVVSTTMEDIHEPDVFGFASVLNLQTYQNHDAIQYIQQFCRQHCPATLLPHQKQELELCWSGTTKRPVGLFVHHRMINMPMEIVYVLQEQLIHDMDWAVDQHANTDDTEDERKAHDFGAFLRLAPAERESGQSNMILYKYFDDEIFKERSEFHYVVDVAPSSSNQTSSNKQCIVVMVLTKTGHRAAMNDLKLLIHGR